MLLDNRLVVACTSYDEFAKKRLEKNVASLEKALLLNKEQSTKKKGNELFPVRTTVSEGTKETTRLGTPQRSKRAK